MEASQREYSTKIHYYIDYFDSLKWYIYIENRKLIKINKKLTNLYFK